jgi:inositol transport system substrate-binding protein
MKASYRKFSLLFALFTFFAAMLAACGGTPAATPTAAPAAAATAAPAAPAAAATAAPAAEPAATAAPAASGGGGGITIGATIAQFDTFLSLMADGMQKEADSQGVAITLVNAKEDTATQLSQVENFIAQKVSAIIVNPVDTSAVDPITKAAQAAKIPLVYINRLPATMPKDDPNVVFVGSNSIDAGTFQGQWLADKLGGKGSIVIMEGKLDNEAAVKRTEGVETVMAKYPDIKITKKDTANWNREEGRSLMENWLQTGEQIDAVASNNDEMALGALQAIEASGKLGQILVGGVDATPDALASMEAGKLNVTVFQDAAGQGGGSIKAAVSLVKGEKVDQLVYIPYQLVTPENYKEFKK